MVDSTGKKLTDILTPNSENVSKLSVSGELGSQFLVDF
jgi:hypothetical protein